MPRTQQIVPSYDVPHVMTVVNDNSTVSNITEVVAADPIARFLCVFPSAKGPDGVRTITSTKTFIETYGQPNMKTYGQASYMPYLLLSTGRATVHCMRITPANAQYANVVVMGKCEVTDGVAELTLKTTYIGAPDADGNPTAGITDLSTFESAVDLVTDADGFKPMMAFAVRGRGVYGNNHAIRITPDINANRSGSPYMNYVFNSVSLENGAAMLSYVTGTMYPTAIINNRTQYMYDVINDPETGDTNVMMYVNEEFLDEVYGKYVEACEATTGAIPVSQGAFDILAGAFRPADTQNNAISTTDVYRVVYDDPTQTLNSPTGIRLDGGSDGDFASDAENRDVNIIKEYLCAFGVDIPKGTETLGVDANGNIVAADSETSVATITVKDVERYGNAIASKRRTPSEAILDANYPIGVKRQLVELAKKRFDAVLYLDSGKCSTISELEAFDTQFTTNDTMTNVIFGMSTEDDNSYIVQREAQWFKTRDPFTGKAIDVTMTWYLALNLPQHITTIGNQVPFVGERYALLTNALPNSVRPNIDADDLATKQSLYEKGINTFDTLSENRYMRATQVTSQTNLSDLSEGSNVFVLLEMKRMLEEMIVGRLYDFASAEDRTEFTEDAKRMFETYPNRKVREYDVSFDMNEFEQERNILHCYLSVTFRQIATRSIIEIDINKRA